VPLKWNAYTATKRGRKAMATMSAVTTHPAGMSRLELEPLIDEALKQAKSSILEEIVDRVRSGEILFDR
jgi:hypothetical protein